MEQILILIVFYILYLLFNALANRQRKLSKAAKAPRKSVPLRPPQAPADASPSPDQPLTEAKEPQLELPPFLREMLGLDEPQRPRPLAETVPAVRDAARREESPAESPPGPLQSDVVETEPSAPLYQEREVREPPARRQERPAHPLYVSLRNKSMLKQAFILKEILDAPLSRRPRQFFKILR